MKCIAFIASTFLIVLLSRHSTQARKSFARTTTDRVHLTSSSLLVPLNETEFEQWDTTERTVPLPVEDKPSKVLPSEQTRCNEDEKLDGNGTCQPIDLPETTQETADLKSNEREDEACPKHYVRFEGSCLFIRPRNDSVSYTDGDQRRVVGVNSLRPKSSNAAGTIVENVPVRADNSCPEGTEYSERGVCQKIISSSEFKPVMNSKGSCPVDFELVDGKCTYKNPTMVNDKEVSTVTPDLANTSEAPELDSKVINSSNNNQTESTEGTEVDMSTMTTATEENSEFTVTTMKS